jgi:hypothetical protein
LSEVINYAPRPTKIHRPAWVRAVVGLYLSVLALIAASPAIAFASDEFDVGLGLLVAVAILVVAGLGLVLIPVRVATMRPPTGRKSWAFVVVATGGAFGLLVLAGTLAAAEWLLGPQRVDGEQLMSTAVTATLIVWVGWTILFVVMGRRHGADRVGSRLYQIVMAGSALELLIAVPAHIVVRKRTDCCAGIYTGFGLACGMAIMLISLGPALAILYYRKAREIRHDPLRPPPV